MRSLIYFYTKNCLLWVFTHFTNRIPEILKEVVLLFKEFQGLLVVPMSHSSFLPPCCHCQIILSMVNHPSIHLYIHPSIIQPFIHPSIHLSVCPSIPLSIHLSIHSFIQQLFIEHWVWARYSARWWLRDTVVSIDICPLGGYSLVSDINKEINNYHAASGPVKSLLRAQEGESWPEGLRESPLWKCCASQDQKDKKEEGKWDIFQKTKQYKTKTKGTCYSSGQRSLSC